MGFVGWLLCGFIVVLAIPCATLFVEVMAATVRLRRTGTLVELAPRRQVAVLVPAHNEGSGIQPTLADVKSQLRHGDRLVVIADNCTDDTAQIAEQMGAEVTARNDPTKFGKGYALDWGMRVLADVPPEIIIIVDADCRVSPATIDTLALRCSKTQRPVQALYLMTSANGAAINHQVAEFAWRLKNWVRPLGLSSLNWPCQLMGSGMAFPWGLLRTANLANGFIVEDLKLGLELALAGHPPIFCPSAIVTSTFPTSRVGARTQRRRWEQGHIGLIFTMAPWLIYAAVRMTNWKLLVLLFDLLVPPISLLLALLSAVLLATAAFFVFDSPANDALLLAVGFETTLVVAALALAWFFNGRDILPAKSFLLVACYFVSKLRFYAGFLAGQRATKWIRSDRTPSGPV